MLTALTDKRQPRFDKKMWNGHMTRDGIGDYLS